ncbi:hypothetical protein LV779_34360 [Streptomyces thinghirensis]|nr:hypothetical protein [Streptomyces thinghirensis]
MGRGKADFTRALFAGGHQFAVVNRPGRQIRHPFVGAELPAPVPPPGSAPASCAPPPSPDGRPGHPRRRRGPRRASTAYEADRIGLVIGGNNLQRRELVRAPRPAPGQTALPAASYGLSFLDTDLCGLCTSASARGSPTPGALGELAVIEAGRGRRCGTRRRVRGAGRARRPVVLGAARTARHGRHGGRGPRRRARRGLPPLRQGRSGFVYGEACAALVVGAGVPPGRPRPLRTAQRLVRAPGRQPRSQPPSLAGGPRRSAQALDRAGLTARDIDYTSTRTAPRPPRATRPKWRRSGRRTHPPRSTPPSRSPATV